jgi:hypothetical protein
LLCFEPVSHNIPVTLLVPETPKEKSAAAIVRRREGRLGGHAHQMIFTAALMSAGRRKSRSTGRCNSESYCRQSPLISP